jgi:uncharacterized protein YggE
MKTPLLTLLILAAVTNAAFAEASGNLAYSPGYPRNRPEENERIKRVLSPADIPPGSNTMFLEASVLMNVKADEYVAVFALSQEADTPADCTQKMDRVVSDFRSALKPLGIGEGDLFVDFVAQNKIYGYRVDNNVAKEELAGFELKKNISVHYRDKLLLDQLVLAAAQAKIFDLVKVDYIVRDTEQVQDRLMQEAAGVIKRKEARYEKLLGIKLLPPPQVYAEKPSIYYPSEMYQSYTAYEAEQVDRDLYRSKYLVQDLRKNRTFFFNPLTPDGFDNVINPVVLEPVVQFTLYLKVKYDIDPRQGRK